MSDSAPKSDPPTGPPPSVSFVDVVRSIGPAIIVASVVLGPGSILSNSKVGAQFGYNLVWVLAMAALVMIGMTATSARLGVYLKGTLCDELAERAGRPLALLTGVTLFLVAACFQFSNNLGVLFALEPLLEDREINPWWLVALLVGLNAGIIVALFGFRQLYKPVERAMKFLVAIMMIGFAANLLLAQPSILKTLAGLIPNLPDDALETLTPQQVRTPSGETEIVDHLWAVQALIGTTFSVAAAFYQSYLVRQKGWTPQHLRQGLADSIAGITVLAVLSGMIMITAAAAFFGEQGGRELNTAADVAKQLEPLFGPWAVGLFCMGIFAGAISSFLVNAMIGGAVLSDGLGRGGSMDDLWPKLGTTLALLGGMGVAIGVRVADLNVGNLIIFAQALTVMGNPLLAGVILWLATRPDLRNQRAVPPWMLTLASLGFVVVLLLSIRTAVRLYLQVSG